MRVRNWSSNLFNVVGAMLVLCTITVGTQLVNGQPQPLSAEQLKSITGGGDCEDCEADEEECGTENEVDCDVANTAGEYVKTAWTGQDEIVEQSDLDSGVVDAVPNVPKNCMEEWSGCDKVDGSCANCESTSTTSTVNTNCHFQDPAECPAS